MYELLFQTLGIAGTTCFLMAYFWLQKGKFAADSYAYLLLNLAGAILLMISLFWDWNLAAFMLEAAWCAISIYGLYKRRRQSPIPNP